tara:strand:+ start:158 stop:577 length:420 start_codon:yes stop_codon:yes gene_type:complete
MSIRNKEQNSVLSRLAYIDKQMTNPKLTDKEIKVLKLREKNLLEMLEDDQDTFDKGGMPKKKKKVPVIAISVGMAEMPKNGKGKAKMMRGGTANKKEHMYSAGGSVTDNLKPMPTGPKGKGVRNLPDSVQMNMGFDPKS